MAVRLVEPEFNVELRDDQVVFAFPYQADVVAAVRGIPGRRFDWDRREWSAPAEDHVAPHVRGVIDRFPGVLRRIEPQVEEWLADLGDQWIGRVTTSALDGRGWFSLARLAGELPEELAPYAVPRGEVVLLPFERDAASALLRLPGARLDARALRCAVALEDGSAPAPATLTVVHGGTGEPRFGLDVNWDPLALVAFLDLPEADRSGRAVPIDPFVAPVLDAFLDERGVEIAPAALEYVVRIREEAREARTDIARSSATAAPPIGVADRLGGTLEPFQHAGVRYVLRSRRCFLADEQGLGKTVQALAALEEDGAFPAVVLCPASLKLNWEREAARWLPHRSTTVVSGTAPVFPRADITILNYEIVHAHQRRLLLAEPRALVLDESHYCKNPQAKRTQATRRLAEGLAPGALRVALTGTPVLNRPEELVSQLRILGRLHEFGSGASFARRFKGMGAEQRLHWHLRRRCFARRLKADVLPQLPAKRRVILPVELTNRAEYRRAEEDVIAWLQEQPMDLSVLESKMRAALRAERLAQLTALKRLAARGKLAAARSWIGDFLESGEKLVVFGHHREVLSSLLEHFPDAGHLLGTDDVAAREAAVQAFQSDDGPQLIICSTRVAAHGITLTAASNVCFLEQDWTPAVHDQAEDRVHRMGQRDAVVAWYLLAAGTIDETMAATIERKRGIVGAVTDGRPDESLALVDSVIAELRGRPVRRHLRAV